MKKLIYIVAVVFIVTACSKSNEQIPKVPTSISSSNTTDIQPTVKESTLNLTKSLKWVAYKKPVKEAVNGTFDNITLGNTNDAGTTIEQVLTGAEFSCDGLSSSTQDKTRDNTISNVFFRKLENGATITGKFVKFENNVASISLKMNDVEITKDFTYTSDGKSITMNGVVDILQDFKADKAFKSLADGCYSLHEGKTWSDVNIEVIISK